MFLVTAGLVALVWWGAKSVFEGAVTAGELAQFMIYALMATSALASISEVLGSLQTVAGATERLIEILDTKPTISAPARSGRAAGAAARHGARSRTSHFAYETREGEKVIDGSELLRSRRGETVALVGPSGAGKSTVFALVAALLRCRARDASGSTASTSAISTRATPPRFAYVEQEPTIFAGTVAENIRFGKPDATQAEVEAAARAALVHDFVVELPRGLRHHRRRARRHALGRPEAARRHRPRAPQGRADPAARRSHLRARCARASGWCRSRSSA